GRQPRQLLRLTRLGLRRPQPDQGQGPHRLVVPRHLRQLEPRRLGQDHPLAPLLPSRPLTAAAGCRCRGNASTSRLEFREGLAESGRWGWKVGGPGAWCSNCGKLLAESEVLYTSRGEIVCQACTTAEEVATGHRKSAEMARGLAYGNVLLGIGSFFFDP